MERQTLQTMALILFLLFSAICTAAPNYEESEPPRSVSEGDVIQELLSHRGDVKHGLPKLDKPLSVFSALYLNTVTKADPETGYVEFTGFMTQVWNDPRLRFEYRPPFRGIYQVRLDTKDVWTPDLELSEVAPPGVKLLSRIDEVIVDYNGTVRYYPFVTLPVFCDIVSDKGNDSLSTQFVCELKIGSSSYDIPYMNVDDRRDFDLMFTYRPKGQWVVTSIEVKRHELTLPSLGKTYAVVIYTVKVTSAEN